MKFKLAIPLSVVALLFLPLIVTAQSKRVEDLGVSKLLVSGRDFPDPAFAKAVILLVEFNDEGTVGLMINRRTKVPVSRALEQIKGANDRSYPVYLGGPVDLATVLALLRTSNRPDQARKVVGDVYLVSSQPLLEKTLAAKTDSGAFHVFMGYCGWAAGQLENEMNLGAWYIFDGDAKLVFDSNPDSLWSRLIARTEQILVRTEPPAILLNPDGLVKARQFPGWQP